VVPVITASIANLAPSATSLVIHGFGFSTIAANDVIDFGGGVTGKVTSATATTLTITGLKGLTANSLLTATLFVNGVSSEPDVEVANIT
jgi:hypothetical protein